MQLSRVLRRVFLSLVVITLPVLVSAQQPSDTQQDTGKMPMGTVRQCRDQNQSMKKSVEQLSNMLADAKRSNDTSKMRDAIDKAQQQLADMKQNMDACRKMMDMMEKSHGGMMK